MTSSHEERKTYDPDGIPHQKLSSTQASHALPDDSATPVDEVVTTGTAAGAWAPPARIESNDWLSAERSYAQQDALQSDRWRGEAPSDGAAVFGISDDAGDDLSAARADDVLSRNIAQRVIATDHIDVSHVHVAVARANVILTGSVLTERHLKEIEALVAGCPGVRRIDNRLHIQSAAGGR